MTALGEAPARPSIITRWWFWAVAIAVLVLLALGAWLLFRPTEAKLSFADQQACDALEEWGNSAAGGDQNAAELLYVDLEDAGPGGGLSDKLSPYALLVDGSAQVVATGGDSPDFEQYVGEMRGVCETLGWRAVSG